MRWLSWRPQLWSPSPLNNPPASISDSPGRRRDAGCRAVRQAFADADDAYAIRERLAILLKFLQRTAKVEYDDRNVRGSD